MRQKITLICSQATILLLVMLLTSVSAWAGSGDTYVVDANGGGQYTSISAAVNAATGGETISIKNGEYTETSRINIGSKRLSFIGESQDGVIIHSGNNDLFYTTNNGYSSISIHNLTFKDISMTGGNFPIFIGGNGSVTIDHCTFDNCASAYGAIHIFTSGSVTINNCTLMNTKSSCESLSSAIDFGGSSTSNYEIKNTVIDGSSISDANTANFIWGVIYNEKTGGTVTLDNVTIRNCNLDKAVGLIATKGNMTIKNSTIVNNYVYGNDQNAGFIFIYDNKTVTIETSMILNNRRPNNFLTSNNQFASFNLNYNNIQGNTFNTAFTKSGNTTYTLDANYWGSNTLPTGVTASTWVVKNNQGNYELNNGNALPAGKSIPECSHSSLTAHPAVAVTCLDNGNSAYWQCNTCGTYFSDDQGSTIIPENSWVIPATGHTLNKHEEVPATCTTAGSSAYWECSNCHKYFSDAGGTTEIVADSWVIPATGHYFGDWVVSTPAKCLENGSKYRECTVCHAPEYDDIPALGHDLVNHDALAATCTTAGHTAYQGCSRCDYKDGYTEIPALTHNVVNGECTLCHRVTTAYVDADGTGKSELAMPLNNTMTTLEAGWYVVNGNIEFNSGITLNGDVNLILADGYQMNIGTSEARISDTGIDGLNGSTTYDLEIFGQSNGTGAISVYTSGSYNHGIRANVLTINGGHITANTAGYASALIARGTTALTINGGTVSATTDGDYYALASNGDFNYNGGNVITSAPNGKAIFASRKYTFSWRSATDRITIGSTGLYTGLNASSKTATFTRLFTDADGNYYGGTMTGEDALATLAGKTLSGTTELVLANDADNSARIAAANGVSGLDVKLDSRTLQANIWNTLCVPFNLDGTQIESIFGAGTLVKTLSSYDNDGTTVTITFATANTIEAGKPYIILLPEGASNMVNPVFSNVVIDETMNDVTAGDATFKGTYSPTPLTANDKKMLFLANNKLWYPTADVTVRACRAYFELTTAVPELSNSAPNIVIDFGEETTSLSEELRVKSEEFATAAWYTLDGRKLSGKPTTKGIYINGGHKVVVK